MVGCRKRYEPNEIILYDNYAEMLLYNRDKSERCRVLLDIEDISKVNNTVWSFSTGGYVRTKYKDTGICTCIHRVILEVTDSNVVVDHINMNRLDNRKSNLRLANKSQNSMNRETPKNNTYGFRGVSYDKRRDKFRAYIKVDQKQISLGYYTSFEDAKTARLEGEVKYFKEFKNETEISSPIA